MPDAETPAGWSPAHSDSRPRLTAVPLRDPFRKEDKNIQQSEIVFISLQIVRKNSRDDLLDFAEQK